MSGTHGTQVLLLRSLILVICQTFFLLYFFEDMTFRHGGDFAGLTKKLNYIKGLGCNAVWISPIFQTPGSKANRAVGIVLVVSFSSTRRSRRGSSLAIWARR